MASAVFSGINEHYWINKNNHNNDYDPDFRLPNNNPNPTLAHHHRRPYLNAAPPPRFASSPAPTPPPTSYPDSDQREIVTFHLSSYSRRDLKDLRQRLISELDQVRSLRTRIEALAKSRTQTSKKKPALVSKGSRTNPATTPAPSYLFSPQVSKIMASIMRKCSQMLNKLMKHRHGWVFNKPVDAVSLGLHDYYTIIRNPMDLGTVKLRMSKKEYITPIDFAGDVRLTFNNAMVYNPKGQDVYLMAQELLTLFENMFNPAFYKYESDVKKAKQKGVNLPVEPVLQYPPQVGRDELGAKTGKAEKPKVRKRDLNGEEKSRKKDMKAAKKLRKKEEKLVMNVATESRKVDMRVEVESLTKDMSFEEKTRLVIGLQELPQNKLDEMVKIIKKRNINLAPDSDETEMELDIELIDNETLWELDRLVKDHEKMVNSSINGESSPQNEFLSVEQHEEFLSQREEDVDIGDEAPVNFPPLEIELDGSSSSSGSSSDSSSSSDSDSLRSDSDGESVQSPIVQARGEDPEIA